MFHYMLVREEYYGNPIPVRPGQIQLKNMLNYIHLTIISYGPTTLRVSTSYVFFYYYLRTLFNNRLKSSHTLHIIAATPVSPARSAQCQQQAEQQ